MSPTHFCCVWVGQKYGIEYVHKLYRAVKRNFSAPMDFTVLTDNCDWQLVASPDGRPLCDIKIVIVPPNITGYWNKLFLFARGKDGHGHWPRGERVVYFDLDVLVCGSLDWLLDLDPEPLWMARDSIRPARWNSSFMMWHAGNDYTAPLWSRWLQSGRPTKRQMPDSKGDQAWIEAQCRKQKVLPVLWQREQAGRVQFYYSPRLGTKEWDAIPFPAYGTSVVVFHGKPHFDELQHTIPWVKENWK